MNNKTGIWIDGSKAIIVSFENNLPVTTTILSDIEDKENFHKEGDKGSFMGQQHISHEKTFEERKKHQLTNFLNTVLDKLKGTEAIFVFGPAETKTHLKKAIENDRDLRDKLQAVEPAESMTENQLIAKVKEFYEVKVKH